MEQYKCIIIDDELFAIQKLENYINLIPNLSLVKYYTDSLEALDELLKMEPVDLILMDIDMPYISGIELSKEVRQKTKKLVITTAHMQYGYDAFEVNADAYLLKPFSLSKFASTVLRLFPDNNHEHNAEPLEDFFFVKNKNEELKIVKVKFCEVVSVESKLNYIMIHTTQKKILTYMALTEISKILMPLNHFVQFQRSFIINKNFIEHIEGNMIKMSTGLSITVGDYYRKNFSTFLAERLIKTGRKK